MELFDWCTVLYGMKDNMPVVMVISADQHDEEPVLLVSMFEATPFPLISHTVVHTVSYQSEQLSSPGMGLYKVVLDLHICIYYQRSTTFCSKFLSHIQPKSSVLPKLSLKKHVSLYPTVS